MKTYFKLIDGTQLYGVVVEDNGSWIVIENICIVENKRLHHVDSEVGIVYTDFLVERNEKHDSQHYQEYSKHFFH